MKFNFDWFQSKERKGLLILQLVREKLEIDLLEKKLEKPVVEVRPYKKLIYSNGNITVVLPGGVVINQKDVSSDIFESVKNATTEKEINDLLISINTVPTEEFYSFKELQEVRDSSSILLNDEDFIFLKGSWFLRGVNLPIEPILLAAFIEIRERILALISSFNYDSSDNPTILELENKSDALKMFWRWAALNPIEASRRDLFTFIRNNDISITKEGMLELYRRVVSTGAKNKELVKFISEQYFKIKKWKKSPKSYIICRTDENKYELKHEFLDPAYNVIQCMGNLEDLYLNLPSLTENIYTDNHTKTKVIKIGEIYREDEDKIDLNNQRECSNGLHTGSRSFGFHGFGDVGVVVLVNPMKVRSVPLADSYKMRVSEMFIVGVVELEEYSTHVDSNDTNSYSEEYSILSLEELEEQLANKSWNKLTCQDNVPAISIVNIKEITEAIKNRIINF